MKKQRGMELRSYGRMPVISVGIAANASQALSMACLLVHMETLWRNE